jgi:RND family efflux transporter MFP subunit
MIKKARKWIIWIVIIAAVIFGIYKYFQKDEVNPYVMEKVSKGRLVQTVSVTGKFNSDQMADMAFKSSGRITVLKVDIGDRVDKGQLIATIDKSVLYEQLRQAEADIKAQKKTISDMVDKRDLNTKDQRDSQRAVLQKIEAGRDAILRQMRETSIYSPIDGIVIAKNSNVAEMATAGSPIVTIADPGNLVIESNVPEVDIASIQVGQSADIVFDSLTDQDVFKAKVVEIYPASTVIQDVVYYKIKLKMESDDSRLKIGMSCDVDVLTDEKDEVLMVSRRAVKSEDDKQYIEILKMDGKIITTEKVYVETGLAGDGGMIEVKSGLTEGQEIIVFSSVN